MSDKRPNIDDLRIDAREVKLQLDRIRRTDLKRETHAWLKANSAINDILDALGEPQADQPERAPDRG